MPTRDPERIYANRTCPYCSNPLDTLPAVRAACPECGRPIHVRSGPDGLTYLLQERDLSALEAAWSDYEVARHGSGDERREAASRYLESTLAGYREAGVRRVQVLVSANACDECRTLGAAPYDVESVPALPYQRCQADLCRCDYVPVLDPA